MIDSKIEYRKVINGKFYQDIEYYQCYICKNMLCECEPHFKKDNLTICTNCLHEICRVYLNNTLTGIPKEYIIDDLINNKKIKRYISKRLRNELLNNAKCSYCGSREKLEIDHIFPISKGGTNDISNLQVLCSKCNRVKSNKING